MAVALLRKMSNKSLDPTDLRLFGEFVTRFRQGRVPGVLSAPEGILERLESIYLRAQMEMSGAGRQTFTREEADLLVDCGQRMHGAVVTETAPDQKLYLNLGSGTQNVGYDLRGRFPDA